MNIYSFVVIGIIVGYLCGSIPFGVLIGKIFYKVDVRKYGSNNSGATNVTRTLGAIPGLVTMILDLIKGGLPAMIMYFIAASSLKNSNDPAILMQVDYLPIVYFATGVFAAIGHCNPIFAGFKGGKAVASISGFLLFMNWKLASVALFSYLLVLFITKIVSLSSMTAAVMVVIFSFVPWINENHLFDINNDLTMFIFNLSIVLLALLLIYRHYPNILRLINKEEKKFKIEKITKKEK